MLFPSAFEHLMYFDLPDLALRTRILTTEMEKIGHTIGEAEFTRLAEATEGWLAVDVAMTASMCRLSFHKYIQIFDSICQSC